MRIRRLTPIAATAAALLALIPASAQAFKHPGPGGCHVNINVAPREITAGDPVVIFGRLRCRRAVAAGQTVELFHHLRGGPPGFTYVQSVHTDANGFYEFSRADGVVDSNRAWYVLADGARSARRAIRVAAQVTLAGPPEGTQILTGVAGAVTFTGTVSPADVGARVILQRQNAAAGDDWHAIQLGGVVQAGGGFTIRHVFRVPGDANIRVLVRSQGRNVPSPSNLLNYDISQAQNPALTINASADPIPFGQSVTINGILMGGSNKPVTLLARVAGQRGFAPVAQATTNGAGEYAFPAQSPVRSTFYKVAAANHVVCAMATPGVRAPCPGGGGKVSAVLYEGVRDVLTAQVSTSTVQAGGQVTFSGTVSPSHAGHVIYLERRNAIGADFHVAEVGFVNPDSSFSIVHRVYDVGTKVFRVFIPGGPENFGAASETFTVQVTPAPAAALTPESPANSALPSEGGSSHASEEGSPTGEGS
ncbi:MAG TPA: hypothetical protein VGX16_04795 [Solirubrobacteraceae bacterium]|jgi:hypothetical protein|nr:hypothetical protein [Solirubrobacteraceae bacterium]